MAKLGEYRRKRKADATNEPFGDDEPEAKKETLTGAFVVHLHDATRRHYDLRLEVSGVLASFAVPRGPSLDPEEKHLAVKTEDHPIEYLEFEDVIPAKQYGAGPMIAWDRGMVEYLEGPAETEIANGKLHVKLEGMKLHGEYGIVKLAKSVKGDEWLLFKKKDEHASTERDLVTELPRSVFSGLTVEELERAEAIGAALEKRAFDAGARKGSARLEESPLMIAASGKVEGTGSIFDAELEGVRVLASRDGDVVELRARSASGTFERVEAFYPEVVRALRSLAMTRIVLDGELVAFNRAGYPSMRLLAERAARIGKGDTHRATVTMPVVLVASDILALGDADLRQVPLEARRAILGDVLPELGFLRAAPPLEGAIDPILAFCASHRISGVVAKKKGTAYDPSKKTAWFFVPSGIAPRSRAVIDHGAKRPTEALRKVALSNRAKIFWPEEGYTKGDLCDYYADVADVILPHLADRPVILVRYPDGIAGKNFYQWNVPPGMPPWVRTLSVSDEEGVTKRGFLLDDASTLLYIANLACIPVHVLAWRTPKPDVADFFTIDFDVKQSELRHAITLAHELHEILDAIGLPSFPKTSGQSGLHVLVPLGAGQNFTTARGLAELLGKVLAARFPKIATMERVVQKRGPKVYVDTGQTGETRAIVAPYSVRAVPGATVSTPLAWDEVTADLDPRAFTMKTVPARIAKIGDPMQPMRTARPDVARAIAKLAEVVK